MLTDKQLIRCQLLVLQLQRQDQAAARELVEMFERSLLYYLRRMVQNEADAWDLLQECWMSVFRSIGRLRDPKAFPSFLYRTARNCALARLRQQRAEIRRLTALDPPVQISEPEPAFDHEDAAAIHAALETLTLPHREALTLYFLQELTLEQIARLLGIPEGTVKSRLHHAKKALAAALQNSTGDHHVPVKLVSRQPA